MPNQSLKPNRKSAALFGGFAEIRSVWRYKQEIIKYLL